MGATTKTTSGAFPSLSASTLTKVASDEWIQRSLTRLEVYEELREEFKGKLETAPEGDGQMMLLDLIVQLERRVAKLYRQLEVIAEAREGSEAKAEAAKTPDPGHPALQPKPKKLSHIPDDLPPPPLAPGLNPNEIPPPPLRMSGMTSKVAEPKRSLDPPPDWGTTPNSSSDAPTRPESAAWQISKLTRERVSETPSGTHSIQRTPDPDPLQAKARQGRGARYRTMREVPRFKGEEGSQTAELEHASGSWKRPDVAAVQPASPSSQPTTAQPETTPPQSVEPQPAVVQPVAQPQPTAQPVAQPQPVQPKPFAQPQAQPAAVPTTGSPAGTWQQPGMASTPASSPATGDWQRPQAHPAPAYTQSPPNNPLNRTKAGHPVAPHAAPYVANPLNRPHANPVNNPLNQARLDPHPAAFPAVNNPLNAVRPQRPPSSARLGQPFPFRAVSSEYDERGSAWTQTETYDDDDLEYSSGNRGIWFFVFLLLAGAAAGGYYWYTHGGRALLAPPAAAPESKAPVAPRVIKARPVLPDTQGPAGAEGGSLETSRGTVFKKSSYRGHARGSSVASSVEPGDEAIDPDSIRKPDTTTKVVKTDDPFEGADQ